MLGKTPNKVYDSFLKSWLGYQNPERLKKATAAQPKMLSKLNDENVLLKTQVDSVVQERENIKLEYQKLFNSIKATRAQHQQEVNELIESISQKTYSYGDVRSKNQDLLMVISELKNKIKAFEKRKGVNTKFDKSVTSGTLLCVTPLPNNIAVQAKKVSKQEDKTDRSKPVTSHSTLKNEQKQKKNANVIARGMYKIPTQESQTQVSKTNMNVSNSTGVESSNSVRRPKSKDTKSKNRVLKNTNDKSSFAHDRKMSSSVSIDSNKRETMNSTEQSDLGTITSQQSLDMEIMFKALKFLSSNTKDLDLSETMLELQDLSDNFELKVWSCFVMWRCKRFFLSAFANNHFSQEILI
ncbi:hypothetical protein Tco_0667262 [Tanacetum coccineum]